jgi:hypothetical protein
MSVLDSIREVLAAGWKIFTGFREMEERRWRGEEAETDAPIAGENDSCTVPDRSLERAGDTPDLGKLVRQRNVERDHGPGSKQD